MSTKTSNETTLCFTGDLYLKTRDELRSAIDESVMAFLNSADACFINFASPISGFRKSYIAHTTKINRDINCSAPDVLSDFTSVFPNGVVSFANDHLGDLGSIGIIDTIENLENEDIPFIGAGRLPDEELKTMIIGDHIKVGVFAVLGKTYGIPKLINKVGPLRGRRKEDITLVIKELREKCDYVVLIYHGGYRYNHIAEPEKRSDIIEYLDNGCDVVVAHHPHSMQRPEIIDGKYVFYSIGDLFLTERAEDITGKPMEGAILKLEFSENGIKPILQALNIGVDRVTLSDNELNPSYITNSREYRSAWLSATKEQADNKKAYLAYNREWKLDAYKQERDRIVRALELIDNNRNAADLEGIEAKLNNMLDTLDNNTAFILSCPEDVDIEINEFRKEAKVKAESKNLV